MSVISPNLPTTLLNANFSPSFTNSLLTLYQFKNFLLLVHYFLSHSSLDLSPLSPPLLSGEVLHIKNSSLLMALSLLELALSGPPPPSSLPPAEFHLVSSL